jgi:Tfp pilus assembly protein PilF
VCSSDLGKIPEAVQASLKAAELYIKNKDTEKAVNSWIRAISLRPDNVIARTRLAMIYERMGQKAVAVTEYLATASIMQ